MTQRNRLSRRDFLLTLGGMSGAAVLLAACGGGTPSTANPTAGAPAAAATAAPAGAAAATAPAAASTAPAATGAAKTIHFLSVQTEDTGYTKIIGELAREYQKDHPDVAYEFENIAQADLIRKIQLLAGQNALPTIYPSPSAELVKQLVDKGQVVDIEQTFKDLAIADKLNPVALGVLKQIRGTPTVPDFPVELNIEGFWYNKKIFADNALKEPGTWDELLQIADTLNGKGVQPFSASGDQKWPITRLISGYAFRKLGTDAIDKALAGSAKLTDPGYVEAAQAIHDIGIKGYFGKGVTTIDYDTAVDTFLQGKAAMFYMGSWELRDYNDPKRNTIGAENIGFFNVPLVKDGKGTIDDWAMNAGQTIVINKTQYDDTLGDWIKYVFGNYADRSMSELGAITGFTVATMPASLPPLTKLVQEKINSAKNPMLWLEAKFSSKASTVAADSVQRLVTEEGYTGEQYMADLQKAIEEKA